LGGCRAGLRQHPLLELYVKAEPGWRDSRTFVEELDWRRELETSLCAEHALDLRRAGMG
jgi:hypothetical protein